MDYAVPRMQAIIHFVRTMVDASSTVHFLANLLAHACLVIQDRCVRPVRMFSYSVFHVTKKYQFLRYSYFTGSLWATRNLTIEAFWGII